MKIYADTPARRTRQVIADLLVALWVASWCWVGVQIHDGTMALAGPGRQTDAAASTVASGLREAGGRLDDVPLIGGGVAAPFDSAADGSESIAQAGRSTVTAVERLALLLAVTISAIPILLVVAVHLPLRLRFVRRASAGARFVDGAEDLDLFALRALTHQPMHVLARISDDPAAAWRRGDAEVLRRLGELELRHVGLRPPRPATTRDA